jgi:hypothetical protein
VEEKYFLPVARWITWMETEYVQPAVWWIERQFERLGWPKGEPRPMRVYAAPHGRIISFEESDWDSGYGEEEDIEETDEAEDQWTDEDEQENEDEDIDSGCEE